jgi:hypothetical protein
VTGRIIDADVDALASIARLTAQVATLKREVDQYEAQLQLERREGRELGLMYAGSNERLQESLTAVEQERDDFKRIVEVWRKRHGGAEDRVRVLEGALREVVRWGDKLLWSIRSDACGWIYGIAKDALTPAPPAASHTLDCNEGMTYGDSCSCAPPAETPAPTYKHGIVEIGACLSCIERDRLRAELAAEKKRADEAEASAAIGDKLLAERNRVLDALPCPTHGQCVPHALDEIDRLRAELAAAKKRADEFAEIIIKAAELNASKDRVLAAANEEIARLHASMKLQRDATKKALDDRDATTAQLGRAAVVLRGVCDAWDEGDMTRGANARRDAVAILADADGTQAAAYVRALDAAVAAARFAFKTGTWPKAWHDAIAAVDARRGAVAK